MVPLAFDGCASQLFGAWPTSMPVRHRMLGRRAGISACGRTPYFRFVVVILYTQGLPSVVFEGVKKTLRQAK
jgi:hypothetical protein